MSEQANPRNLVVEILLAAERGDAYLDRTLRNVLTRHADLPRRDRAWIKRVSEGTTERRIEIDFILDQVSDTKVKKMKPVIRAILRSAVYQLLFLDAVPDAAVVSEAVALTKQRGFSGLSGYVNGVLRAVGRERGQIVYPSSEEDPIRALSVRYSMPEWITERFLTAYGAARCERILAAYLAERPLCVRVDTRAKTAEEVKASLEAQNICVTVDSRLPYTFYLEHFSALESIPEFADGTLYPQDVSSMLALEAAEPQPGDTVLDVCAAPGGKSLHAAALVGKAGHVTARDKSEAKVRRIRENLTRCQAGNVSAEVWDARTFDPAWEENADLVIADLPCSGLGVIGHKSDIKYRVTPDDILPLAALQREILSVAMRYVRPGGALLYSTCTVTAEENQENTQWLLARFPEFLLEREHQILPDEGCDGFYYAKLKRK